MVQETARRREIEDVASTLFREHGYSGTSVRDIARALDIQGASLYAHVASKQDVLWSIVERMATRFEAAANAALAPIAPDRRRDVPSGDAGERLTALVRGHVEVVTDDVGRASVFVREWRSLSPGRRAEIGRRRDAYERRFRTVIARGHRERRLRRRRPGHRRGLPADRAERDRHLVPPGRPVAARDARRRLRGRSRCAAVAAPTGVAGA